MHYGGGLLCLQYPVATCDSAEDELERFTAGVRRFDFDKNLAALPYYLSQQSANAGKKQGPPALDEWMLLTSLITPQLLELLGISLKTMVHPGAGLSEEEVEEEIERARHKLQKDGDGKNLTQQHAEQQQQQQSQHHQQLRHEDSVATPTFLGRPIRQRRIEGMAPQEVTRYNTDANFKLATLLDRCYRGSWELLIGKQYKKWDIPTCVSSVVYTCIGY